MTENRGDADNIYTQERLEIRAEWTYLGTQLNRIRLSK